MPTAASALRLSPSASMSGVAAVARAARRRPRACGERQPSSTDRIARSAMNVPTASAQPGGFERCGAANAYISRCRARSRAGLKIPTT